MMFFSPGLVRARVLTGLVELVSAHGGDAFALVCDAGISPACLDDPEATMPVAAFAKLMRLGAETLDLPDFGQRLATYQDITVLGAIALIAQNAETVGEALEDILRHYTYHATATRSRLTREGDMVRLQHGHDLSLSIEDRRQIIEHMFMNTVGILRTLTQHPGHDWQVHFDFNPYLPPERYAEAYRCAVNFGAEGCWLGFPAELLDIRLAGVNTGLRVAGERYIRTVLRRHPLDISLQVKDLIQCQLGTSNCSLPLIAQQLAISGATLQRRLAEQGTCFEDIIDTVRQQRAKELLSVVTLSTQRIAECLGYSSQTSLTRACRRWFGTSPKNLRRRESSV